MQRALRDDSVVVRVDGMVGETTVDPMPLTVVRTTSPRHEPGTRLLYLHEKACVDATDSLRSADFHVSGVGIFTCVRE